MIDASIPLQVKPFQLNDPLEQYGRMLAVKGAQRQFTMEDDIAQAAKATNAEPGAMADQLLRMGHAGPAMQLRAQQQQQAHLDLQNKREDRKANWDEVDHHLKLAEAGAQDGLVLDQLWNQALQKHGGDPIMAITEVQPIYSQVRQKWLQIGNGKTNLPEAFDPDQNRASIGQAKGIAEHLKQQREDQQYRDIAPQGRPAPAVNSQGVVPLQINEIPPIEVTGKAPELAPDDLRKEANRMDQMGTKQAFERAERLRAEANRMYERIWKEREQIQPQAGAPGVTFNKKTGEYLMDGKVISAEKVQQIANLHASKSAANVNAAGGDIQLGKAGSTKVDEGLLDTTSRIMRLDRIQNQFKPEYQQTLPRLSNVWTAIKERAGRDVAPEDRKKLEDFTKYKRNSIENLNQYIKETTGAAMSEAEAVRLRQAMPDPGDNWYNGDSPTQFKSKMDDVVRSLKMAEARLVHIKRNGISMDSIPLEKMPEIINQRGAELEKQLAKPGAKPDEIKAVVRRQLAQEFGLVYK